MTYLDYNATSPLRPSVRAAMEALGDAPLNPASVHASGRAAKKLLEDARATIASALSAFPNEVLFTASATEANNMVLRAFAHERTLLVSAVEHASVAKTAALLGGAVIPVDSQGLVQLDAFEAQLKNLGLHNHALISVMLANNETGAIQPIADIVAIARKYGALVHCDAVQALGKIPLDWGLLGVDMLTICAHKAGGPVGVGALLIRNDLPIKPLLTGGGQELGRRAGTQNIPAIIGLAALVKEVAHCPEAAQWLEWREWLAAQIQRVAPEAKIFGLNAARLPQTLCISMPGVKSETQIMNFDLAGFAVSAGSACSSGRIVASHVLLAMGVAPEIAETAIRISWGWATTRGEIEAFAKAWETTYLRITRKAA